MPGRGGASPPAAPPRERPSAEVSEQSEHEQRRVECEASAMGGASEQRGEHRAHAAAAGLAEHASLVVYEKGVLRPQPPSNEKVLYFFIHF